MHVTWRFWDHKANVSASISSTFNTPQRFTPNVRGIIDPSNSVLDMATNNRMPQVREAKGLIFFDAAYIMTMRTLLGNR